MDSDGHCGKISGENSITTHLATGGEVRTLAELYGDPRESRHDAETFKSRLGGQPRVK